MKTSVMERFVRGVIALVILLIAYILLTLVEPKEYSDLTGIVVERQYAAGYMTTTTTFTKVGSTMVPNVTTTYHPERYTLVVEYDERRFRVTTTEMQWSAAPEGSYVSFRGTCGTITHNCGYFEK